MIQKAALRLAEYSIAHKWIDPSKAQWCSYALEKQIGTMFFITMCLLTAAMTAAWAELFSFVLVFYLFRQRMGGWHAKHFWTCQLLSLVVVVSAVVIIGPLLEWVNLYTIVGTDIFVIVSTFFLKPSYPTSAHFSREVLLVNVKRKKLLLLELIALQLVCLKLGRFSFLTYSLLGLTTADLSVLLQYGVKYKKG